MRAHEVSGEPFVDPGVASVAVAVLRGAREVRDVASACGVHPMTAYGWLRRAARQGLVDWEPGLQATLRSTLRVVAADKDPG